MLLPGSILPAEPAYAALLAVLGDGVDAVAKDLELYAGDGPPPDYDLALEVEGIGRTADARGFDRFNLVGYSGGGAAALAFAAVRGERLRSLALLEPAWAGNARTPAEDVLADRFSALEGLSEKERMAEFTRLQLAPGVEPPPRPEGALPPWMAKRPAGVRTLVRAFEEADLDLDPLRRFTQPVLFVLGGRSNPDYFAQMAGRLAAVFPNFTVETFPERHHFDPPHRAEPERVAGLLVELWLRAA